MERIGLGHDSIGSPAEKLLTLVKEDREWEARLIKRAGGLHRGD